MFFFRTLDEGDNLSILIEHEDSMLHIYQTNPREIPPKNASDDKYNEMEKEKMEENNDDDDVKSLMSTKSNADDDEIPSVKVCKMGLILSKIHGAIRNEFWVNSVLKIRF